MGPRSTKLSVQLKLPYLSELGCSEVRRFLSVLPFVKKITFFFLRSHKHCVAKKTKRTVPLFIFAKIKQPVIILTGSLQYGYRT